MAKCECGSMCADSQTQCEWCGRALTTEDKIESISAELVEARRVIVKDTRANADLTVRAEAAEERVKQLEASAAAWGLKVWDNR
jgi:hypothetical protein